MRADVIPNAPPKLIEVGVTPQFAVVRSPPERRRPSLVRPLRVFVDGQLVAVEVVERKTPERDEGGDPRSARRHLRRYPERLPLAALQPVSVVAVPCSRSLLASSVSDYRAGDAVRQNRVCLRHPGITLETGADNP